MYNLKLKWMKRNIKWLKLDRIKWHKIKGKQSVVQISNKALTVYHVEKEVKIITQSKSRIVNKRVLNKKIF